MRIKINATQVRKLAEAVGDNGNKEIYIEELANGKVRFYEVKIIEKLEPIRMTPKPSQEVEA